VCSTSPFNAKSIKSWGYDKFFGVEAPDPRS
jgi:hypothetical protein